jgi:hypothetical protein
MIKKILKFLGLESYTIPLTSFKEQFGNMMDLTWKEVKVKNPSGLISTYKTFPIDEIKCQNDNGELIILRVKPSLEMRITDTVGKKTIFYFDRIKVENGKISGSQSRFIKAIQKEIPFHNISKIEIQDGKKRFKYV